MIPAIKSRLDNLGPGGANTLESEHAVRPGNPHPNSIPSEPVSQMTYPPGSSTAHLIHGSYFSRHGKKKHLVVDDRTTFHDLSRLYALSQDKATHKFLLGRQTGKGIALYFGDTKSSDQRPHRLAITACEQMLANTLKDFDAAGSIPSVQDAVGALVSVEDECSRIPKEKVPTFLSELEKTIYKAKEPGPSLAARDTPRMPVDCMINLIFELEKTLRDPTITETQKQFIRRTQEQAKDLCFRHQHSFDKTRDYFSGLQEELAQIGLSDLAELLSEPRMSMPNPHDEKARETLAKRLQEAPQSENGAVVPGAHEVDNFYNAALNDNIFGRALESFLAEAIINNPAKRTLESMAGLASYMLEFVNTTPREERSEIQESMRE